MRFNSIPCLERITLPVRIMILSAGWLVFISILHFHYNYHHDKRQVVQMGYMPVITNLASPVLDHVTRENGKIRFRALKFASFAEMAEALRHDRIQVAFMIAPLAIVLRQQGEDIKIVYIGNRHESTLVAKKNLMVNSLDDLSGRTLAVPMRYSGHNLSILELMDKNNLHDRINVVEMNPPDMASALAAGSLDAYYVGEPFAAQTIKNGDAKVVFYVEEVWRNFVCNLVIVKNRFIQENGQAVQLLVQAAARSGFWAWKNPDEASKIASKYWNQSPDLVKFALTTPQDRILYSQFIPRHEEIQHMADLMVRFDLISKNDITGLIDDRFAKNASVKNITDIKSILAPL